jgi:hypothetical protein
MPSQLGAGRNCRHVHRLARLEVLNPIRPIWAPAQHAIDGQGETPVRDAALKSYVGAPGLGWQAHKLLTPCHDPRQGTRKDRQAAACCCAGTSDRLGKRQQATSQTLAAQTPRGQAERTSARASIASSLTEDQVSGVGRSRAARYECSA